MTREQQVEYLRPKYTRLKIDLSGAVNRIRDILWIEDEYVTMQNDAMRELCKCIERYREDWI